MTAFLLTFLTALFILVWMTRWTNRLFKSSWVRLFISVEQLTWNTPLHSSKVIAMKFLLWYYTVFTVRIYKVLGICKAVMQGHKRN